MRIIMNNTEVSVLLEECYSELEGISAFLVGMGEGATPTPYVKKYAVIRATGSIETGFKKIIADRVDRDSHTQLKNFITRKIRNSSYNPRVEIIQQILAEFDVDWKRRFDEKMALADQPTLKGALTELVKARNDFAHGGISELPIADTISYFGHGCTILKLLDQTVHEVLDIQT